jgi:hypothetical protein
MVQYSYSVTQLSAFTQVSQPAPLPTCPSAAQEFAAHMAALAAPAGPKPAHVCHAPPQRWRLLEKDGKLEIRPPEDLFETLGLSMHPTALKQMSSLQQMPLTVDSVETQIGKSAAEILARTNATVPAWMDEAFIGKDLTFRLGPTFHLGPFMIVSDPVLDRSQQLSYIQDRLNDLTKLANTEVGLRALQRTFTPPPPDVRYFDWIRTSRFEKFNQVVIAPPEVYSKTKPKQYLVNFDGVDYSPYYDRNHALFVPNWARDTPTPILLFRSLFRYLTLTQGNTADFQALVYVRTESGYLTLFSYADVKSIGLAQFAGNDLTENKLRAELGEPPRTFVLCELELNPDGSFPLLIDRVGNVIDPARPARSY